MSEASQGAWFWPGRTSLVEDAPPRAPDLAGVHARHADFVWSSLQRLGVRGPDLEDQLQEVFVVVHRRLPSYDGSAPMTAWLFGICRRVAAAYRRRGYMQHEVTGEPPEEVEAEGADPERAAAVRQARARLGAMLDSLDLDKRVVFVMFEIEGMGCEEISSVLGIPVGTVYSRLHVARRDFEKALARHRAREARMPGGW